MAQNWDYSELSKAAKAAGGPEKMQEEWRCYLGLEQRQLVLRY